MQPITKDEFVKYYHDPKFTVAQAAEKLGVLPQNIIKIAYRLGVQTRRELGIAYNFAATKPSFAEKHAHITDDELTKYYHDPKLTIEEIEGALCLGKHTIQKLVRSRGIQTRRELGIKYNPGGITVEQIKAALASSASMTEAATKLGITTTWLYGQTTDPELKKLRRKGKPGPQGGYSYKYCGRCKDFDFCRANPHADKLPCEVEATPYAEPGDYARSAISFTGATVLIRER